VHYVRAFISNAVGDRRREASELESFLAAAPDGPVADRARMRLAEARQAAGS
jgi:hypothetical protein